MEKSKLDIPLPKFKREREKGILCRQIISSRVLVYYPARWDRLLLTVNGFHSTITSAFTFHTTVDLKS